MPGCYLALDQDQQHLREVPGLQFHRGRNKCYVPQDCLWMFGEAPVAPDAAALRFPEHLDGVLRDSQREDVAFTLAYRGAIIAHPTAAGKTLVGLTTAYLATREVRGATVLVIGPAIARPTWVREQRKWFPEVPVLEHLRGRTPRSLDMGRWYFVNYEVLDAWADALSAIEIDVVIQDEGHELRGRKTIRNQAYRQAVALSKPLVQILTATPVWNRIPDLHNLLDMVHPGEYGSYSKFAMRYADATIDEERHALVMGRTSNASELQERLRYVVRRLPRDQLGARLPDADRRIHSLTNPEAVEDLRQILVAAGVDADMPQERLREIISLALQAKTHEKIAVLHELVSTLPGPVLCLTQTRKAVTDTHKVASQWPGYTSFWFHGAQSIEKRVLAIDAISAAVDDGLDPNKVILTVTGPSVKQSLDILAGVFCSMVFLEFPWTGEELIQNEGRLLRPSQQGDVVPIRYVVLGQSIDQRVLELLLEKLSDRQEVLLGDEEVRDALRGPIDVSTILADFGL